MADTKPNVNQYYNRPHTHLDRLTVPNASTRELWELLNIYDIKSLFDIVPTTLNPELVDQFWEVFLNRYAYERIYTYWDKWVAEFASRIQSKAWVYNEIYDLQNALPVDYLTDKKTMRDNTEHQTDNSDKDFTENNSHNDKDATKYGKIDTTTHKGTLKDTGTITDAGGNTVTLGSSQTTTGDPTTERTYSKTTTTNDYPDLTGISGSPTTSTTESIGGSSPERTESHLDQKVTGSGTDRGTSENTRTLGTTNTADLTDVKTLAGTDEITNNGAYETYGTEDIKKIMDALTHTTEYGRNASEQELSDKMLDYLLRLDLNDFFLADFSDMFMRSRIIHPTPIQGGFYGLHNFFTYYVGN